MNFLKKAVVFSISLCSSLGMVAVPAQGQNCESLEVTAANPENVNTEIEIAYNDNNKINNSGTEDMSAKTQAAEEEASWTEAEVQAAEPAAVESGQTEGLEMSEMSETAWTETANPESDGQEAADAAPETYEEETEPADEETGEAAAEEDNPESADDSADEAAQTAEESEAQEAPKIEVVLPVLAVSSLLKAAGTSLINELAVKTDDKDKTETVKEAESSDAEPKTEATIIPSGTIKTEIETVVEAGILHEANAEEAGQAEEWTEEVEEEIVEENIIYFSAWPDFNNLDIWQADFSPYHQARLWGQCTWFSWHRFYEIYGFDPGFIGRGALVAYQLVNSHPDKFELSTWPTAGAVFSYENHTGVILAVNDDGTMCYQDGNYDGVTNYDWNVAINDWDTNTVPISEFIAMHPDVIFAVPTFAEVIAVW